MRSVVGALLALVVRSSGESCFLDAPTFPLQDATVRLMARDWPSHRLVTEVAAILLREQLKFDVELVMPDSVPLDDYQRLSQADFDANLEIWPSGKDREYRKWVTEGDAIAAGEYAVVSEEGIYVPKYVVDKDRTSRFYKTFQKPTTENKFSEVTLSQGEPAADAGLCADPAWNCSQYIWHPSHCREDGVSCRAQVLHGPVSWFQGKAEQLIERNNLNLSLAYLTMKTLDTQVWDAYAGGKAFAFYDYSPREAIHGLDKSSFARVQFPPKDSTCVAARNDVTPLGHNGCDAPKRALQKVVSERLTKKNDALHLVKSLMFNSSDYDALFKDYEIAGHDANKAACQWLKRVGKDRWGSWVQYSRTGPIMPMPELGGCWAYVWCQALLLLASNVCFWCIRRLRSLRSMCRDIKQDEDRCDIEEGRLKRLPSLTVVEAQWCAQDFKVNMKSGHLGFLAFKRSESEFLSSDGARAPLPQARSSFRVQTGSTTKRQLVWYAIESSMSQTLMASFKFACLIGILGSLVHIAKEHAKAWQTESFLDPLVMPFARVVKDFGMLPAFMVALSVNATVSNWMTWLGHAGSAYGRICDTALIIGGLNGLENDDCGEGWRSTKFKFYRYLNAVHYLCFHTVDPRVGKDPVAISDNLARAGLLTSEEASQLGQAVEMHSTVLVWLSLLWDKKVAPKLSLSQEHKTQNFVEKITAIRTAVGSTKAQVDFGPPDITRGMLYAVTSTLLAFILLSYPLTMYVPGQCFQWGTMLCGTLYIFCYHGLLTMGDTLNKGPFDPSCDCVNADHLLCWAEMTLFQMLQMPQGNQTEVLHDKMHIPGVSPALPSLLRSVYSPSPVDDLKAQNRVDTSVAEETSTTDRPLAFI